MNVKTLSSLYDSLSSHCTKEYLGGFNFPLNYLPLNACHYSHQLSQQHSVFFNTRGMGSALKNQKIFDMYLVPMQRHLVSSFNSILGSTLYFLIN